MKKVDVEDKTLNELFTVNGTQGILINESGFYSLVLSSKLPSAKKFKHLLPILNIINHIKQLLDIQKLMIG